MRLLLLVAWGMASWVSTAEADAPASSTLLRYTAVLSQTAGNGRTEPVREFGIQAMVEFIPGGLPRVTYLFDEPSEEQPWSDAFGRFEFDPAGGVVPAHPRQRHIHDDRVTWVPLRMGAYPGHDKLQPVQEWDEGGLRYRVLEDQTINSQPCRRLEINGDQGRRTTLSIAKSTGLILAANHRFFVGQGERHDLNLRCDEVTTPAAELVTAWGQGVQPLIDLREALRSGAESLADEPLTEAQIALAQKSLVTVDRLTDGTPFATLAAVIRSEVTAGSQRAEAVADLARRFVGRPVPPLRLQLLDGGEPINLAKPGVVTVLHFWEYRDAPLTDPYGQVGYLDFLVQRYSQQKVQVYGVISDKRLEVAKTAPLARRSAMKLKEFMNFGYPLGEELEKALAALGDPRTFEVDLPLWVVIGPEGTILHYHVGIYQVDPSEGLTELDAVIKSSLNGSGPRKN